ncbi:MAG: M36 family metallopeptidase, partial [Bacteroidota bacterium]
VEGLKYTRCNPSLIDGRDGILTADEVLFDGANSCLIWETFSRRGLGFSASAGNRDDRTDNVQAFDISPYCIGGVQLVKTVDEPTINPGEGVTFTLEATSYRDGLTKGVVITDVIPDGMTLDENSIRGSDNFTVDGNQITFSLGEMEFEDTETILYSVATDPDLASIQSFFDDAEDGDDNWELENPVGNTLWELNDTTPYAGEFAWFAPNVADEQDQILRNFETFEITGDKPALRFFTKYDTEPRWDAGIVEVSADGTTWDKVDDKFLRGSYRGEIDSRGTDALQGVNSFWGAVGYRDIVIDLSDYIGQNVFVRFHWFSDAAESRRGWWVDNIELLDVINYDGQATLTSDEGDNWVTEVGNLGVLVESSDIVDNTNDPRLGQTEVTVFPNPANDFTNVRISSERPGKASLQLISADGRMVYDQTVNLLPGTSTTEIPTDQLPAGVYLVQVIGANRVSTTKLTLR